MNQTDQPTGFILVDKPADWTSFDVVAFLRKVTGIKKIGHTGTLDPFATGLLIVAVSRGATKLIDSFHQYKKVYEASFVLGATSDTQDLTGNIFENENVKAPSEEEVNEVLKKFIGEQKQIPPMFSAKKIGGQKLYDLARKGIEIERKPNLITIHDIEFLDYEFPNFSIRVTCSTGTYIRTLGHDIGQALGTGAYCEELRRTQIGDYSVEDAIQPKEFDGDSWKNRIISV